MKTENPEPVKLPPGLTECPHCHGDQFALHTSARLKRSWLICAKCGTRSFSFASPSAEELAEVLGNSKFNCSTVHGSKFPPL